jgi:hypothetical protein
MPKQARVNLLEVQHHFIVVGLQLKQLFFEKSDHHVRDKNMS